MSKRFENGYVALVITCAVLLTIIALVSWTVPFSKGYQAADQDHQSAYAEHNSAQEYYEKCVAQATVQEALECYQQAEERDREQQAAEQDLDAQREMANWAEGMLWATVFVGCITIMITGLGVYWVRDTLTETRNAVKAANDATAVTRKIGEVQASAYFDIQHLAITLNSGQPHVDLKFFNSGQTPAHNVLVEITLFWGESHESHFFSVFESERGFFNVVAPSQPKGVKFGESAEAFQEWFHYSEILSGCIFARIHIAFTDAFDEGKYSNLHYFCDIKRTGEFDAVFGFVSDPRPPYY